MKAAAAAVVNAAASAADDGNRPGTFFTVGAQQWDNYGRYQVTSEYLDSPGSAATHSYTIALSDQRDAQLIYVNRGSYAANNSSSPIGICSITCMEILAFHSCSLVYVCKFCLGKLFLIMFGVVWFLLRSQFCSYVLYSLFQYISRL